jgi:hypothetical protein
MLKFSQINEAKKFYPDPSVFKRYASFIIPLYIQGELKCEDRFLDEWLEMYKSREKDRNSNMICDLEVLAIKNLFDSPLTPTGYLQMKQDIDNRCQKLEIFLRKYYTKKFI